MQSGTDAAAQKVFLIISLSCLGDTIITSSLCRNIKKEYPGSKVVYLVNKPFYEAAAGLDGVDDVITFDKSNKSLFYLLKFLIQCPYRNKIYAAFIIYGNFRGIILSRLLGAENRISSPSKIAWRLLTKVSPFNRSFINAYDINNNFFKAFTGKEAERFPLKYNADADKNPLAQRLKADYKTLTGLCCVSEEIEKDMPFETAEELIKRLNAAGKTPVFLGKGREARAYADNLKKRGCTKFVDLVNITSIKDLAAVLAVCEGVISIDTGIMHLAYAVNKPVICVFYKDRGHFNCWAPDLSIYGGRVYTENTNFSPDNLIRRYNEAVISALE